MSKLPPWATLLIRQTIIIVLLIPWVRMEMLSDETKTESLKFQKDNFSRPCILLPRVLSPLYPVQAVSLGPSCFNIAYMGCIIRLTADAITLLSCRWTALNMVLLLLFWRLQPLKWSQRSLKRLEENKAWQMGSGLISCLFLFAVVQSETGVRGSSVRIFKMKWIFPYYLQWSVWV